MDWLMAGIGGFAGSSCRFLFSKLPIDNTKFPIVTLLINIIGSFLISFITEFSKNKGYINSTFIVLLTVGFCGGFTTFSTFSLEILNLLDKNKIFNAVSYAFISIIFCVISSYLGKIILNYINY